MKVRLLFLTVASLLFFSFSASAIDMNLKNVTVEQALAELNKVGKCSLVIKTDDINLSKIVSVDAKNASVQEILDQIFVGQNVSFTADGSRIIVTKKEPVVQKKDQPVLSYVKGSVVDNGGQPVIGAGIVVLEDATKGTITDIDGNWKLNVPAGSTLRITSVGYKTKEVKVSGDGVINVTLEDDINLLDDVVVIGYGTARKGDMSGSISTVKGDVVSERSTQMLSSALQGQTAGLQITRTSGKPGDGASLMVHGVTTMSTNDPLIIIDGIPGDLDDVIADDVENIVVLKDAASASIYGSRAAAGVILVTTKNAKTDKVGVTYDFQYAIDTPTARPSFGNVIDWFNVENELKWNDGAGSPTSVHPQDVIDGWLANNAKDPYHYPNTDWMNLVYKKTTAHQQHGFSVSGGSEKLRSKLSVNYQKGDGYLVENQSYNRIAVRFNNDWQIAKWLNVKANIDFSKANTISPAADEWTTNVYALIASPFYNPYWEDGRYADVKNGANVLASIKEGGNRKQDDYKFGGKLQFDITPFKGLTVSALFAPRFYFRSGKNFLKAVPTYFENGTVINMDLNKSTSLAEGRQFDREYTSQLYANYANRWGDHSFSVMAGYEGFYSYSEYIGASRTNYSLDNYPYLNIGPEGYQYNEGYANHYGYQSVFGRLMYTFKDRYILQANIRGDESSRFAKSNRLGIFPSVSAGWVISGEPWFKSSFVNYLKLRGSYGSLGNERIGSYFPYQATMVFGNSYMFNKTDKTVTAVQTAAQEYYAFNDITWETTTSACVGIDANLFDSRLRLNADLYHKKTMNMLLTLGFPSYSGFSAPSQNAGDMYTNGWDLELGWSDKVGDFSYAISANLSDYRSKMGYLSDKRTINGNYIIEEGSYYNELYIYEADGLIQSEADMTAGGKKIALMTPNDQPGCIKYVDQNGDGVINEDDKIKAGNSLPGYLYGGNIKLGYKDWDFNMSFQGIGHQNILLNTEYVTPLKNTWGTVPANLLGNYWSKHNTAEENLQAKYPLLTNTNQNSIYAGSTYWLYNGGYFRVKNITLGYTLPKRVMDKTFMRGLRIYASVTDLPAVSNSLKGFDPEYVYGNSFFSTSFIFGFNVNF